MDALIGQLISDRYIIQTLLGKQRGRRTFLATDCQTQQSVVIKLILFGPDFTWEDLKLFEREAETLKSLQHLAIPQYLDSFEVEIPTGRGFVLVQTYIEAQSLQSWVSTGRTFDESELKQIATQLLNILTYLHSRNPPLIHRDIKPSNILLSSPQSTTPDKIYLVDFGSVQTIQHDGTVTVVGTYGYMPPEQFGGRSQPASDLYSLGATLIYLATGKHPADLTHNNFQIEFSECSNLTLAFSQWIKNLVCADLSQRTPSSTQAAQQLDESIAAKRLPTQSPQLQSQLQLRSIRNSFQLFSSPHEFEIQGERSQVTDVAPGIEFSGCIGFTFQAVFWICLFLIGLAILKGIFLLFVAIFFIFKNGTSKRYKVSHITILKPMVGPIRISFSASDDVSKKRIRMSQMKHLSRIQIREKQGTIKFLCRDERNRHDDGYFFITGTREDIRWIYANLTQWNPDFKQPLSRDVNAEH